jgi:hypothetical protein
VPRAGRVRSVSGELPLAGIRLVQVPSRPVGAARAAAVRAAAAPVVVLGETHAFPEPDWGERLLDALDGDPIAVAPGLENANPELARSWAGFLLDYGLWLSDRKTRSTIPAPPSYNAAWKRDSLIALGDALDEHLELGAAIGGEPAALDGRFVHEPRALVAHLNIVRPRAWIAERYIGGRLFGARRGRSWPASRRCVYAGGCVLVPAIRYSRTRPALRLAARGRKLPRGTAAGIAFGSVLWALGEAHGYLAGAGRSDARMLEYEMHKARFA